MRPVTIAPMQAPPETAASALAPALQSWIDILQAARLESRPVRLVGGGSKAFLCLPPAPNALALHTGAHRGIVAYEPSELVLTARAGTPLAEIEALLATQGQCLAFEPPHFGPGATLGGAVAAGLSGPARASAGALRDFVLGVHVLNGRGATPVEHMHPKHEIAQRPGTGTRWAAQASRHGTAKRGPRAKVRRLKSQALTLRGQQRFDLGQWRAGARREHQLRGFVGHDAAVSAGVQRECIGRRGQAQKGLAATADEAHGPAF